MRNTDDFFVGKRPWSLIKDEVLRNYMNPYIAKVNRLGKPILLIDGYAGPGIFEDRKEGSPLIICKAAERYAEGNYTAIFVNKNKLHHLQLSDVLASAGFSHSALPVHGDARKILENLPSVLKNQTVFLYLDPFGPTGCEFSLLEPFLKRNQSASTEIVLMMHMPIVHRLATRRLIQEGAWNRRLILSYHARLTKVFGGDYWKAILWNNDLDAEEQKWRLIQAYSDKLKEYLPYSGYCPVREAEGTGIKYFIVFVSRHPDTMVLMNDIMAKAYHGHMHRQSSRGTLFEALDWREMRTTNSFGNLEIAITEAVAEKQGQTRKELWTEVVIKLVPQHFMEYTEVDYRQRVQEMMEAGKLVCPTPRKTKRLNDDCRLFLPH